MDVDAAIVKCCVCHRRVNVVLLALQEFRGRLGLDFLDQK